MHLNHCASKKDNGHIVIRARCKWNDTGIDLVGGDQYRVTASGMWFDARYEIDAAGYRSDSPIVPRASRPLFKLAERWRRMPSADWFSLVGAVNRDGARLIDLGSALSLNAGEFTAPATGRLFCFANDLPFMYWNNKGQVLIKINRVSSSQA